MGKEPLVSIIMPVYNADKYLSASIESVLTQSYLNWELIAIDDASTDESRKILSDYSKNDSRINVVEVDVNSGVSNARNIGINCAKGEYLCWLDADDIYDSHFLKIMIDIAVSYQCDIVECKSKTFGNTAIPVSDYSFDVETGDGIDFVKRFSLGVLQTSLWSKVFKRKLFDGFLFPIGKIYEEPYFYLERYKTFNRIGYVNICLYNYRNTPSSIMKTISSNAVASNIDIHNYMITQIQNKIPYSELLLVKVLNGSIGFWKRVLYSNSPDIELDRLSTIFSKIDLARLQDNIKINYRSLSVIKFNRSKIFRLALLLQYKIKQCLKSR